MSQGQNNSKVDRVIELFRERKLYDTFSPRVAFLIELILRTGATPIDIINLKAEHINKQRKTITIQPHKKKILPSTTHAISSKGINVFLALESTKPISSISIRRLQQLVKKETEELGSSLTSMRKLRREFLENILTQGSEHLVEKTQLTSLTQRKILSTNAQKKLANKTYNTRNKALILTLLHSGLRIQEVLLLQKKHIQKDTLVIDQDISHNGKRRIIPLPQILKTYTPKGLNLFSSKNTPLTQRRFEQICKEVAKKLSIEELHPSLLRTTAIYNLSATLSQEELLQQSGLQTSTLYTHGFLFSTTQSTTLATHSSAELDVLRKDNEKEYSDEFMYHRSKLKDGGDTDE